ncbi:hypothetical protein BD413DRAFT_228406 [Trametes elegans]|nr:hypothetical protein BD413DRAFT_228406 [Trametes elegans]
MLADIQVTAVLVCALWRSRTGLKRTDSLIDTLILYTASTGLMNCLLNALDIVLALAYPKTMIYTSFSVVLVKVYGISFLVALNSRHTLASHGLNGEITSPFRSSFLRQFEATSGQRSRTHFVSLPHQLPSLHLDASRSSAVELVGMPSLESPGKRDANGEVRTPILQVEECDE